jgi:protein Tex
MVQNTIDLLNNDASIPFIARYRKEQTGNLDEVQIEKIRDLLKHYQELEKRKEAVIKAIEAQDSLTTQLRESINKVTTLTELEDLYLPYKKKRKTKAEAAREAGLEPLAKIILAQKDNRIKTIAEKYLNERY